MQPEDGQYRIWQNRSEPRRYTWVMGWLCSSGMAATFSPDTALYMVRPRSLARQTFTAAQYSPARCGLCHITSLPSGERVTRLGRAGSPSYSPLATTLGSWIRPYSARDFRKTTALPAPCPTPPRCRTPSKCRPCSPSPSGPSPHCSRICREANYTDLVQIVTRTWFYDLKLKLWTPLRCEVRVKARTTCSAQSGCSSACRALTFSNSPPRLNFTSHTFTSGVKPDVATYLQCIVTVQPAGGGQGVPPAARRHLAAVGQVVHRVCNPTIIEDWQ